MYKPIIIIHKTIIFIHKTIIIVGDVNTYLLQIGRFSRQKISKEFSIAPTANQLYINNIYRLIHSAIAEYTFFSSSYGILTKMDCMLCHKTYLNKHERIK
jgi:hypothetical protein